MKFITNIQLTFIALFMIISCNTDTIEVNCSVLYKEGIKHYLDDSLYSGNCLVFKDENLAESRKIKNGVHKSTVGYHESGEVKFTGGMKNDSLNGVYKQFYKSGELAIRGRFKKGFYEGKWRFFREDGVLQRVTIFKNGKITSEIDKN